MGNDVATGVRQPRTPSEWAATFAEWGKGPSTTEQEKCDNAVRIIREAISHYDPLRTRGIKVFAQGSYRNRTNVRQESDVDVCVLCTDTNFPDYSHVPGLSGKVLGFAEATYLFDEFKRDVECALVARFGRSGVTCGRRAFDIKANSYRVAADVVPVFERRVYHNNDETLKFDSGTTLRSEPEGHLIYNWPEQHYENGAAKHDRTSRRYKKSVRILKRLRNEMAAGGVELAVNTPSFLIECLVYNCPDALFECQDPYERMRNLVTKLWNDTKQDETATRMLEVSEMKRLFTPSQRWTRETTHQFLQSAWHFVGYGRTA